jgi:membrane dipeptidase
MLGVPCRLINSTTDLPWLVRDLFRNNASAVLLEDTLPGHVDIPRLRAGHVGGFFWSVYTPCPGEPGILLAEDSSSDFLTPTNSVR